METLIFLIVLALLARDAVQAGSAHWQKSKAANRASTKGQSAGKRAASAARHDSGYWLHQVLTGFPQTRHGLAESWHAGRQAQAEGYAARQKAKAGHLSARARLLPEIREHRRRQAEALEQIRAARQPEPEPEPSPDLVPADPAPAVPVPDPPAAVSPAGLQPQPSPSPTEGTTPMPTGT